MGLLDGQRGVVTGGGSGIGRATCHRMVAEGAQVAVVDIDGDAAEAVAKELDGLAYAVDVTDYVALEDAVRDAASRLGGQPLAPSSGIRVRRRIRRAPRARPSRADTPGRIDHRRGGAR